MATPSHYPVDEREVEISAIRAQGAGGQNVNKVSSAVHLRFDIAASSLPEEIKERLLALSDSRITQGGVLVLKAQQHRTQELNRSDALARLQEVVDSVAVPPKARRATKPTFGSKQRRLEGKSLRADIKKNLEREVKFRLLARNKQAAMEALLTKAELDLPNASVQSELSRLLEGARAELKQRGVKDADKAPIPEDVFRPQAERRVRLGLVVAELVRANSLQAKPEQIKAHVEELAASYEKPADVMRWYYSDNNRMAEVEGVVIENNVTEFLMGKAKISEKSVSFDELMAQN